MALEINVEGQEVKDIKEEKIMNKEKSVDELSVEELQARIDKAKAKANKEKEVPKVDVEEVIEPVNKKDKVTEPPKTEEEAHGFIQGLFSYLKNPNFEEKIVKESQKSGLTKRQVANNFAMKVLGTISDLVHLGLDTVQDAFSTLVSILAGLLIKGGELIVRCAKRLARIVTLNQTAIV